MKRKKKEEEEEEEEEGKKDNGIFERPTRVQHPNRSRI